jgi:hypothetical protein
MTAGSGFSDNALAIIANVRAQYEALAADCNHLIDQFNEAATQQTRFILQQSEARIKAEQLRYGITSTHDQVQGFTPFADPAAKAGLAKAAGELVATGSSGDQAKRPDGDDLCRPRRRPAHLRAKGASSEI